MVRRSIEILKAHGIKRGIFDVLVGFDSTFEEDLHRLNVLRELGQRAFVMIYDDHKEILKEERYRHLREWCNAKMLFATVPFETFMKNQKNGIRKRLTEEEKKKKEIEGKLEENVFEFNGVNNMKVNTKALVTFLNEVTIGGMIDDALLRFTDRGLCITVRDLSSTGAVYGLLFRDNFQDYQEGMEVAIENTSRLMNMLKMIEGSAELVIEGNALRMIGENFEGVVIMEKKESLHCNVTPEQWDSLPISRYDEGFTIDASIFDVARNSVEELTRKNSSDVLSKHLLISVKDGVFMGQAGEETGDKAIAKTEVNCSKNVAADYGTTLLDFFSVIKGNININFRDDYPMLITSKNENSEVQWFVSPILH